MKIDFLGIPVDSLTMQETIDRIEKSIQTNTRINHVVLNAGKIVSMQTDKQLLESVVSCDLINADGQSIVWAARFLGKRLPERVTGVDLMQHLVLLAYKKGYKCFFLGAKEEVVIKVVDTYTRMYGPSIIAGYRNGYFSKEDEFEIAQQIAGSSAQLLFVAISSPRKENFLYTYREILSNVNFTMGVGGTFDVIAGYTKRAPVWMQKMGLEWFYRFVQEPRRMWRRYLVGNTKFIWAVLKEKVKGKNSLRKQHQSMNQPNNMQIIANNSLTHLHNENTSINKEHSTGSTQIQHFKKKISGFACPDQSMILQKQSHIN
jgi:N-acetylglucosaminyldiphosphoundecaprenol N-acetyl-beta-D-mannosaminyltransferase